MIDFYGFNVDFENDINIFYEKANEPERGEDALRRKGMERIAPSGKFCMAIPTASANAPAMVIPVLPIIAPATVTPTAIPSGRLWRVCFWALPRE